MYPDEVILNTRGGLGRNLTPITRSSYIFTLSPLEVNQFIDGLLSDHPSPYWMPSPFSTDTDKFSITSLNLLFHLEGGGGVILDCNVFKSNFKDFFSIIILKLYFQDSLNYAFN